MTRHESVNPETPACDEPIAVIGMACRFPGGADSPEALWRLLEQGRDGLADGAARALGHRRLARRGPRRAGQDEHAPRGLPHARYRRLRRAVLRRGEARGARDGSSAAAASRGGVGSAREPRRARRKARGSACGVFVGLYNNNYGLGLRGSPAPEVIGGWTASGAHTSVAAGRLSYLLDLSGPSLAVDTACSSSLVAVHLAVRSLQARECTTALAGGVHLILSPESLVASTKLGATAPDGRCKTFDAAADGFGHGEGCGSSC
jgi:acyl transferase domain-containing protein